MRLTLVLVNKKTVACIVLRQIIAISVTNVRSSLRSTTIILVVAEPQKVTR